MKNSHYMALIVCLIFFTGFAVAADNDAVVHGVEMIIWEHQSGIPNGGYKRLTIWHDGRSEVEVAPYAQAYDGFPDLLPKKGWTAVRQGHKISFVCKNIYPPEVTRAKLQLAAEAGIQLLKTFRAGYLDGSATRVVVQINGKQTETVIPIFMENDKGTANYQRFIAVSKILGGFDTDAFEIVIK